MSLTQFLVLIGSLMVIGFLSKKFKSLPKNKKLKSSSLYEDDVSLWGKNPAGGCTGDDIGKVFGKLK